VAKNRSIPSTEKDSIASSEWDFVMYPNPAHDEVNLILTNEDIPKDVIMYDMSGKRMFSLNTMGTPILKLPLIGLAKGAYCVRVLDITTSKLKILIIH